MAVKNVKFVVLELVTRMKIGQSGFIRSADVIIGAPEKDDNGMPVVYVRKNALFSPRPVIKTGREQSRLAVHAHSGLFDVSIKRLSKVGWELDFAKSAIDFKAAYRIPPSTKKKLIAVGRLDMTNPDVNPAMRETIEP